MNARRPSPGDELGAQADAQCRAAAADGLADALHLQGQVPVPLHLVTVHGAPQHDQPVVAGRVRPGVGLPPKVHVPDAAARGAQQRVEGAEDLVGDMLQDEQATHGGTQGAAGTLPPAGSSGVPKAPGSSRSHCTVAA